VTWISIKEMALGRIWTRASMRRLTGDCLFIKGAVFHGYHGVFEEEHELGQKFIVDVEIYYQRLKLKCAEVGEESPRIDLVEVYKEVEKIVEVDREESEELIENLAERIARKVEEKYKDRAHAVRVSIQKPQVALPGILDSSAVEIEHYFSNIV
jgi:dihydroneopterin aldolase